jgi:hypothetical protein
MPLSFPPRPQFPRPCRVQLIGSCCYSLLKPCRGPNWPASKPGTPSHLVQMKSGPTRRPHPSRASQPSCRPVTLPFCQSRRCQAHRSGGSPCGSNFEAAYYYCTPHNKQRPASATCAGCSYTQSCALGLGGLSRPGIDRAGTVVHYVTLHALLEHHRARDMFDNQRSDNI